MQVQEIMTEGPAYCSPDSKVNEAARLMAECDCGEIPVVDEKRKPIGVITDRDIAIRVVAKDKNAQQTAVREVMTKSPVTVTPDADIEECHELMEEHQIRRLVVVDKNGALAGMVALADIAREADEDETGETVRDISAPSSQPH